MTPAAEIFRSVRRHLNAYSVKFSNQLESWNESYSPISSLFTIVQMEYDSPIYLGYNTHIQERERGREREREKERSKEIRYFVYFDYDYL